jgi:cell division septation protein DedD
LAPAACWPFFSPLFWSALSSLRSAFRWAEEPPWLDGHLAECSDWSSGDRRSTLGRQRTTVPQPTPQSNDFSFYKAVGEKNADSALTPQESKAQPSTSTATAPTADAPPKDGTDAATAAPADASGGYYVQVAAVSRQEDAEALVEALKKKQYPAFSANNPSADKFYHVQVGPYTDLKEAEAMRARLIGDGYNPIVKK